jgi:3-deoxy-D-manno-octulosonate 8-phosphate phosphatase (KDO 8-P phosphatase)
MIKLFVMDVDGTLTDGTINIGCDGLEVFKVFNTKDGHMLKHLIKCKTCIITGRESIITSLRAKELKIDYVFQNKLNKYYVLDSLRSSLKLEWNEIAYIGDDINDLECMEKCVSGCPNDSVKEIKNISQFVSAFNGGHGAVRDFYEYLKSIGELN